MRIAVPVWEDRISPVLDTALRLLVAEFENNTEKSRFYYFLDETDLIKKGRRIENLDLDILICGAVSQAFLQILTASGLNIIPEISGQVEEVLTAYVEGDIFQPRFLMPGCRKYRCRRGRKNKNTFHGGNINAQHR